MHLIDFGIATRILKEGAAATSAGSLEGTLAYLAPEQTGRVNRGIDERTDLYSLGVTLYEMLTGALPFSMSDPVELLHSHIARAPLPPHALRPAVPEVLSNITLKLMSKMAEDRYQSASGLRADLQTCLQSWRTDHHIAAFPLGQSDRSSELRLPQKLYGRQGEQAELLLALERVRRGALELVLVSGAAGLGKTELVSELAQPLAQRGGYLARVRFDQQHQGIPYAPLLRACRELLRLLLTEPPLALQGWKQRFLGAVGTSGQILIELLPELELIIGKQPRVAALSPVESQNRFGLLFQNFLRQFASAEHPMVLFLDDLHWADAASLQLVRLLLTDPFGHYLLVVGSYREQELTEAHPLRLQLELLHKERVVITPLALEPLQLVDITKLLADTLSTPPQDLTELAREVFHKTYGNPFFVGQFIRGLYRDQLLQQSADGQSWQWELARIQTLTATDNVADFMVLKVQQLAPQTLRLLQTAACIGSQFDLHTLAQVSLVSLPECARGIAEAVQAGLLLPLDSTYQLASAMLVGESSSSEAPVVTEPVIAFKFPHERVQQAAYATLTVEQREELHLRLGQLRLSQWGKDAPTGRLFDLVSHLNLGRAILRRADDQAALLALAELDLTAGLRAKATAAYQGAVSFFTSGTQLLPESAWSSHHELMFQLHLERAHCECLNGSFAAAEAQLLSLQERTHVPIEQALVQLRLCELCYARGDFAESTRVGMDGLACLGIPMPGPGDDVFAAFLTERAEIERLLAGRDPMTMADLPLLQSREIDLTVQLIIALAAPAYVTASPLYPLLMARQITIALRHGICEQTACACSTYGFLLVNILGEPAAGAVYGRLALVMNERLTNASMACRIGVSIGAYAHFCMPIKAGIAHLRKAAEEGLASGDFSYLSFATSNVSQLSIYPCEDLSLALREVDEALVLMQRTRDSLSTLQLVQLRQLFRALLGRTREPTSLTDAEFDETIEWQSVKQGGAGYAKLLFSLVKQILLNLFGKYEEASAIGVEAEAWYAAAPGMACQTESVFQLCLSLLGCYPALSESERPELERRIEKCHAQLRIWSGHCPENYAHRERLVAAERARLCGQWAEAVMLYDAAISAAHRHGFPLHEAMAHELAGRFHAAADRGKLASFYLTEALYAYLHLGAAAKASALLSEHPEHLRSETRALQGLGRVELSPRGTTSGTTSSHRTTDDHLDVNSVLRASEVISRERAIDKVIEQILYTVLTSAGAQRGFLILDRGGTLQIEAARTISPDASQTGLGIALDSMSEANSAGQELALSVVHYVVRTREVVVLSAAVIDHRFTNDAYLAAAKPRAVLCLPLVNQGRLTGILYLENNLAEVSFSPARIDLLRILAAQAATALENALLLHRIQEATEKVHRTNEVLEVQVAERTAEIQRSNTELQTTNQRLQVELTERTRAERERAELQEQMLQAQRERLAEMSTPLIPITARIMVMPLIGTMDSERAAQIIEVALGGAQHSRAQVVILDITGLRHIDTSIADSLIKTARALRLLGAHAILTGIRAVVAQTLVSLGVDLSTLETRSTLQSAIAYALRHTGESL